MNRFLQPSVRSLQAIGTVALVLAMGAAVVGTPTRKGRVVIDTDELARIVENEEDHVDATDLADWIAGKKSDLRIIDLRSKPDFDSVHIPTAINHSLVGLDDIMHRNETIVLYSEGGVHSAQAWFLLKARGFPRVYFLKGGYSEWDVEVLHPQIDKRNLADAGNQKRIKRAELFGGKAIITEYAKPTIPHGADSTRSKKPQIPSNAPERDPFRKVC